jgi:hypothetical protein
MNGVKPAAGLASDSSACSSSDMFARSQAKRRTKIHKDTDNFLVTK